MRRPPCFAALASFLIAGSSIVLAGPNLITNPSFETGDLTGWITGGNFEDTEVTTAPFYDYTSAEDGNYFLALGPVGSDGTLSQNFSTNLGDSYTFSFWINAVGDDPSDFSAYWDGTQVYSMTDPDTGGTWTQYSFTETGSGSDGITFDFRDDPAYIGLDNISVTDNGAAATPEPGSLLMLGTGLLATGIKMRRRRALH
jgi:hypothetical protein